MKRYVDIGVCGGYFAYLNLWIAVADGILSLVRDARRAKRARVAQAWRAKRLVGRHSTPLNPPPDAAAVSAQWLRAGTSLLETLRFGSMLLDLEPTVDSSPVMRMNRACTREVIVARNPGIKGWLHEHCREVGYATAMRHKVLARRLHHACGLPRDAPLEWVFPDQAAHDAARMRRTSADLPAARAELVALLVGCGSRARLFAKLDDRLGILHRKLAKPRGGLSPAARRRMDERAVDALLGPVRSRLRDAAKPLAVEARGLLLDRLLAVAEELRAPRASPAA